MVRAYKINRHQSLEKIQNYEIRFNENLPILGAGGGMSFVLGVAILQCYLNPRCKLHFRPILGGSYDILGSAKPNLGLAVQVDRGEFGDLLPSFIGGLSYDFQSESDGEGETPLGTFIGAGLSYGIEDYGIGSLTGFAFSQDGEELLVSPLVGGHIEGPSIYAFSPFSQFIDVFNETQFLLPINNLIEL